MTLNSPLGTPQVTQVTVMLEDALQNPPRSNKLEVMARIPKVAAEGTWLDKDISMKGMLYFRQGLLSPQNHQSFLCD